MGYLLSSAIKMQGGVSGPTLTVNFILDDTGGSSVQVYKNSLLYTTLLTVGDSVNVPIVAGDTFYVKVFSGDTAAWQYYVNNVFTASAQNFGVSTSTTYTASGTNIYRFDCLSIIN